MRATRTPIAEMVSTVFRHYFLYLRPVSQNVALIASRVLLRRTQNDQQKRWMLKKHIHNFQKEQLAKLHAPVVPDHSAGIGRAPKENITPARQVVFWIKRHLQVASCRGKKAV